MPSSAAVSETERVDRQQLRRMLNRERIAPDLYALDGGHPSERHVLDKRGNDWVVYYSERGEENGLTRFSTEADACQELLDRLRREPTAIVWLFPDEARRLTRRLAEHGFETGVRIQVPVLHDEVTLHLPEQRLRSASERELIDDLQSELGRTVAVRGYTDLPSWTRPLEAIVRFDWGPGI